ncbi:hypothetical protein NMQ01_01825 [Janibacter sp. CX7]|uniref:hypothetical protein n=1 Tax=Janibacter sp. CX7 TaxID=2963431 RepID=UPI0020CCD1D6|nr:hypothetical protein [Janibacter sp. CX7]UTT66478.1 hypothetical protein NMQ01_01825 [Janibacter sp. CX7]
MSNTPYPDERPDPYSADPYSSDPYVPGNQPETSQPPLPYPQQQPQQPPTTHLPMAAPPGAGAPPPYAYATPVRPVPASPIVLVILSALATMSVYCCIIGIPSLTLGIIALTKNSSEPDEADRMTRYGWICFAATTAVHILGVIALVVAIALSEA